MPELNRAHDVGQPGRIFLRCLGGNQEGRNQSDDDNGNRREVFSVFAHVHSNSVWSAASIDMAQ
jgi:hypothetical protein